MSDTRKIYETDDDILQLWVEEAAPDPFDIPDGRGRVTTTL